MAKSQSNRNSIVGVRFSPEEREAVERAAQLLNVNVSEYVRKVALAAAPKPKAAIAVVKPIDAQGLLDCSRSWREEFNAMRELSKEDAAARLAELLAGRRWPADFSAKTFEQRVEWLDENWTLGVKV